MPENELGQKLIGAGESFPSIKQEAKESFLGLSFAKESLTSDLKFWWYEKLLDLIPT